MDYNVFFWFLISYCLVSYTLALLCGVCLVFAFHFCKRQNIQLVFPLCIESDTGYSLNYSANSSTTNTMCYWLQVHSVCLEGTVI